MWHQSIRPALPLDARWRTAVGWFALASFVPLLLVPVHLMREPFPGFVDRIMWQGALSLAAAPAVAGGLLAWSWWRHRHRTLLDIAACALIATAYLAAMIASNWYMFVPGTWRGDPCLGEGVLFCPALAWLMWNSWIVLSARRVRNHFLCAVVGLCGFAVAGVVFAAFWSLYAPSMGTSQRGGWRGTGAFRSADELIVQMRYWQVVLSAAVGWVCSRAARQRLPYTRPGRLPVPPTCHECGYLLSGIANARCPECGTLVGPKA